MLTCSLSHTELYKLILCVHLVTLYRLVVSLGRLHQLIDPTNHKVLVIVTFKFHRLVIATHTLSNCLRSFFPPKVKPSSGLLISLSPKSVANVFAPIPFAVNTTILLLSLKYYIIVLCVHVSHLSWYHNPDLTVLPSSGSSWTHRQISLVWNQPLLLCNVMPLELWLGHDKNFNLTWHLYMYWYRRNNRHHWRSITCRKLMW